MSDVYLRFWHGGVLEVVDGELIYNGGMDKTFSVDVDKLCWFDLIELAKKCGNYAEIGGLSYLIPGLTLSSGLRKIMSDVEILEMTKIASVKRIIDVYVYHVNDIPNLETQRHFQPLNSQTESFKPISPVKGKKKLYPRRGPPPHHLNPPTSANNIQPQPKTPLVVEPIDVDPATQENHKKYTHSQLDTLIIHAQPTSNKNFLALFCSGNSHKPTTTSKFPLPMIDPNTQKITHTSVSGENCDDEDYDWIDPREDDTPLTWQELLGSYSDTEDADDPIYNPYIDKGKGGATSFKGDVGYEVDNVNDDRWSNYSLEDINLENEFQKEIDDDEIHTYSDVSDEEFNTARDKVRACTKNLVDLATKLQREAIDKGREIGVETIIVNDVNDGKSDYEESEDDILTPPDSGDEELTLDEKKRKKRLIVRSDTNFEQFKWEVGQRFPSRSSFKHAVAKYGILQGRNVVVSVSDKKRKQRVGVKCVTGCPFYLYASWDSRTETMILRRVNGEHTCFRNMERNRQLKSSWVAKEFLEVFKARPHWPAKEIQECIRKAFKVLVERGFAYKVKYAAHTMLHGSMHEHYRKLGGYVEALKVGSPRSVFEIVKDFSGKSNTPIFQRFFNCFEGVQKGWKEGCRNVLSVDACFLKTFLGGQLLSAVGHDGNDQMYPVAWAVVEGENNDSWHWFFRNLQQCLELEDGEGVTVISDEHQAILSGVSSVLPMAEHRHCARHIFAHWHKSWRGDQMKLQFWKIVKAYNMADFNDALQELFEINEEAVTCFNSYNPKVFCRAYMNCSVRCDSVTSNMAETFNAYIINARTKHLIYMMEDIRAALMQRLVAKRQDMEKSNAMICPRIQQKLEKEKAKASDCEVFPSTNTIFNVSYYLDNLVVDLEAKTCTCRKWDMTGIPCRHAIACMFFLHRGAEDFVDECYKREAYMKAYAGSIPPCEGERHWPKVNCPLDPPPIKIGPGRPRKNRIKDPMEDPKKPGTLKRIGMEMTCTICHVTGHNKRGCPQKDNSQQTNPQAEPLIKRPRGRPRKDGQLPHSTSTIHAFAATGSSQPYSSATTLTNATTHHNATAQPSQLGRGGRMIRGGRGARGGSSSIVGGRGGNTSNTTTRGRGRGRRGSNQIPIGVGVFIANDGGAFTNESIDGPRSV